MLFSQPLILFTFLTFFFNTYLKKHKHRRIFTDSDSLNGCNIPLRLSIYSGFMIKNLRRFGRYVALSLATVSLCVACNSQPQANTNENPTLVVGNSPWPGFVAQFVADEKGFYAEEGINIDEKFIQVSTDVNTALAGDRLDVAWTAIPDMVVMAGNDPSLRLIAVSDYSDGADGILAKGVSTPADLVGKTCGSDF